MFLLPGGRPLPRLPVLVAAAGRPGPLFTDPAGRPGPLVEIPVVVPGLNLKEPTGLPGPLFGPKRVLFFNNMLSFDSILRSESTNSVMPSTKALFVLGLAMGNLYLVGYPSKVITIFINSIK